MKPVTDGVELHGCHNYLLCEFFNRRVNRRTDLYNAEDMQIVKNIIDGIRKVMPPEFVVGSVWGPLSRKFPTVWPMLKSWRPWASTL